MVRTIDRIIIVQWTAYLRLFARDTYNLISGSDRVPYEDWMESGE